MKENYIHSEKFSWNITIYYPDQWLASCENFEKNNVHTVVELLRGCMKHKKTGQKQQKRKT